MLPNLPGKLFAIFLMVGMLLYAIFQEYQQQDEIARQNAYHQVTKFVDNVRTKGYITPKMLEQFEKDLNIGSYLFSTDMVHEKKVYIPVYTDPLDPGSFTGEYQVATDNYYKTQILDYLYDEGSLVPLSERKYYLSVEDSFTVDVENKSRSNARLLFDAFTNNTGGDDVFISIPYGGMIQNEDY